MPDTSTDLPSSPLSGDALLKKMDNAIVPLNAATSKATNDASKEKLLIKEIISLALEAPDEQLNRLNQIKAARNPLYEAAKPLLLIMSKIPKMTFEANEDIEMRVFRELLEREIVSFQYLCKQVNVLREHMTTASYCLCTAIDEAANNTPWGGGLDKNEVGPWSSRMLAKTFHGDIHGGTHFFLLVGQLSDQPELHKDLLEVMFYILSLGFRGQYGLNKDDQLHHENIRQYLYVTFTAGREPVTPALSSQWQGAGEGKFKLLRSIPVWVSAAVFGLVLLGMFGWYKYQLSMQSHILVEEINAIGKMTPPPVQNGSLKLAQLLKEEIAAGQVIVLENERHSKVIFKGDDMFVTGQAKVNHKMLPLLNKIAAEIAKVPGNVKVIGHSDNIPIKTRRYPNNQALSEERAASVGDALQAAGVVEKRLEIIGRGDSEPVVRNTNAVSRAKNRRVEIIVNHQPLGNAAISKIVSPFSAASVVAVTPATVNAIKR